MDFFIIGATINGQFLQNICLKRLLFFGNIFSYNNSSCIRCFMFFAKLHQPSFITTIQALFNNEEKKMSLLVEKQFSPFPVARDICLPIFAK